MEAKKIKANLAKNKKKKIDNYLLNSKRIKKEVKL